MIQDINFIVMSGIPGSGKTTLCQLLIKAKGIPDNQNIFLNIEYDKLVPSIRILYENNNTFLKNLRQEILVIIKVFIICLFNYISKNNCARLKDIQHFITFFKNNIGIVKDGFEQFNELSNLIQLIHQNFITYILTQIDYLNLFDLGDGRHKKALWILLDDNMIYLSMKEEVVKMTLELSDALATNFTEFKIEISAIFICLICKLDTAILRNQTRLLIQNKELSNINFNNYSLTVNLHTISKMYQLQTEKNLIEPSYGEIKIYQKNGIINSIVKFIKCHSYNIWTDAIKQHSLVDKNNENFEKLVFNQFCQIIQKAFESEMTKNNIVNLNLILKTNSAKRQFLAHKSEQNKLETSKNVLHQLDKALRRHINKHYKSWRKLEDGSNNDKNIHFFNGIKNKILSQVRNKDDIFIVPIIIMQNKDCLEEFNFKVFDRQQNIETLMSLTELFEKFM